MDEQVRDERARTGGWRSAGWRPASPESRPAPPARSVPGWLHLLLFLLTVVSTTIAGVGLAHRPGPISMWLAAVLLRYEPRRILDGIAFSGPLLATLFAHEMGHYLVARGWRVRASWPFFVPLPVGLGTMGALIQMDDSKQDRRSLVEIGAAGPLVGFAAAFVFLVIGMSFSEVKTAGEMATFVRLGGFVMPESMALGLARWLAMGTLPPEREVVLHPIALSGWYGLYLTWFNLLPFSQLDGGHMAHAVSPRRSFVTSVAVLLGFPLLWWVSGSIAWLVVAAGLVLLALLAGFRHPEPDGNSPPLGARQHAVVFLCVLVFVLCFVTDPLPRSGS